MLCDSPSRMCNHIAPCAVVRCVGVYLRRFPTSVIAPSLVAVEAGIGAKRRFPRRPSLTMVARREGQGQRQRHGHRRGHRQAKGVGRGMGLGMGMSMGMSKGMGTGMGIGMGVGRGMGIGGA